MQDLQTLVHCWFLTVGYTTISVSGRKEIKSKHHHIHLNIISSTTRPCNYKELFNLCHSQFRNVIERIFGAVKKRFAVIAHGTRLGTEKQARVIVAFLVIFNFVAIFDPHHPDFTFNPDSWKETTFDTATNLDLSGDVDEGELGGDISKAEICWADARRDIIAQAMWDQYVAHME
jgi:hypothetical protein